MERKEFYSKVIAYLNDRTDVPSDWAWGDTDNLFDVGIIESFDLPDLVNKIEEITGNEIQVSGLKVEHFYTLQTMYDSILRDMRLSC
ncbi:hypothetical protein SAMN05421686_11618 [Thalassolituus maritimus]|uniref:Acyl carrier protein n=1 Tax=Thalassolituus maritimus TaxID=484498 RepID=A0A1N7Q986_9GAMM|nr:hypothetical protein [Thalassolituus maritimus]SIT19405.1 hypothetical protein SAMN05421686_11618 [Thalassolituus maritimus]